MTKSALLMVVLVPLVFAGKMLTTEVAPARSDHPHVAAAAFQYVGSDKCKMCHRKPEDGEQHPKWAASEHAKAYATLGTPEAMEVGAKVGVTDPQNDPKCLKCHTTGFGQDAALYGDKFDKAEGVGCESCHGAGSEYAKKKVMESAIRNEIDEMSVGLLSAPTEESCVSCHNPESPTYKPFDFAARNAEIKHLIPEEKKAQYK